MMKIGYSSYSVSCPHTRDIIYSSESYSTIIKLYLILEKSHKKWLNFFRNQKIMTKLSGMMIVVKIPLSSYE